MTTKQQLIERYKKLEAIKEELKRREGKNRLSSYKPHAKQDAWHQSDAKIRIALTGNRFGKGLHKAERVLTAYGWKPISWLSTEDTVIGSDGRSHKVLGVFDRGLQPGYKVTFSDNTEILCDESHLWTCKTRYGRFFREGHEEEFGEWNTISTGDLYMKNKGVIKPVNRPEIPSMAPMELPFQNIPVDPYVLGLLLGDGYLNDRYVKFSTEDQELIDSMGKFFRVKKYSGADYGINGAQYSMRILGLSGKRSQEKNVPNSYLWNSKEVRLEILRGLMDTDGSVDSKGSVEFCTTSDQLSDDVIFLVGSLGGHTTRSSRHSTYTYKGKKLTGQRSHRISIWIPVCPFRLKRKADKWRPILTTRNRLIYKIEKVEDFETVCISVDSPDGLFVTEGFILTHNTEMLVAECLAMVLGYRPWNGTKTRMPPNKILICVPTFSAISDYIIPKFDRLEPDGCRLPGREGRKYGHAGIESSRHYFNGSQVSFASYQQELKSFMGRDWDGVGLDESSPKEIFDVLLMRTVDRDGRIMMTLTPENMDAAWIFDDLYSMAGKDRQIFQITGSSYDNPYLPKEVLAQIEARLSPEEKEAKIYGKFKHLMGRVFQEYDENVHCYDPEKIKIEESWPKGICIDPHDRKPFAMAWFAVNPQNDMYFFEEWPPDNFLEHKTPHSFDEYVKIINAIEDGIPGGAASVQWRLMDPNFGRSRKAVSGNSVEEEFEEKGLYFDTQIDDDVMSGHIEIKNRLSWDKTKPLSELNRPKLFFKKGLTNMHRAFLNYTYDTRRMEMEKGVTERPKQKYKDMIDIVRYSCKFDPQYFDPKHYQRMQFEAIGRLASMKGIR